MVTELSPTTFVEERVGQETIIKPSGSGWYGQAMHKLDPHELEPGSWIAAVVGFGMFLVFGLLY
jgi:hypothetical protein